MPKKAKIKATAKKAVGAVAGSLAGRAAIGLAKKSPLAAVAVGGLAAYGVYKGAKKLFGKNGKPFKKKSAKFLVKRAYERKARNAIRMGNLGLARRLLRKKASVV